MESVAGELAKLHVSRKGILMLLQNYSLDEIETQLAYLPHRNAKRPNAFLIDAIRGNYSAPNTFFYAKYLTQDKSAPVPMDKGSQ